MQIQGLDIGIIVLYFIVSLAIGVFSFRKSGKSTKEYFLSGKNMPWWILGISMVATTFSADTPNLVTDIVRTNGVYGNWVWWVMLLTGMVTVFIFSRLWRRSGLSTDIEFYEMRYSGKAASFLRGFRAIYLGFVINVFIMATVSLAAIKISGILLGISPVTTLIIAGGVTVLYSSLGGLRSVLVTDFIQFFLSISGAVLAAWYALDHPKVGGLTALINNESVKEKLMILPDFAEPSVWVPLFLIPFALQWWSTWYPGAEPGGGGYIAQRMLSAKNENQAMASVFLFNIAHYALRPWPWIIVALASILVFPEVADIKNAFPLIPDSSLGEDLAYPAMLSFLPVGVMGLVLTSLIAAYMSTLSTHLNWGSSYITLDFYQRFLNKNANEAELLWVGRISTVVLMIVSAIVALYLQNALQAFQLLLLLGAGTGLIYILRWFWKHIHATAEISAMVISFLSAIYVEKIHFQLFSIELSSWEKLSISIGFTTVCWLLIARFTGKTKEKDWEHFLTKIRLSEKQLYDKMRVKIFLVLLSCISVYSLMMGTGFALYSKWEYFLISLAISGIGFMLIYRYWKKIKDLT